MIYMILDITTTSPFNALSFEKGAKGKARDLRTSCNPSFFNKSEKGAEWIINRSVFKKRIQSLKEDFFQRTCFFRVIGESRYM